MIARKQQYRFTVDDYHRMIRSGIFTEDDRVELIHGEVVHKMPIGDKHVGCVNRLNRVFSRHLLSQVIVSIQNPIRLADSEPEPDVALLRIVPDCYASRKPTAADTLLVIEVGDTSVEYDRDIKLPMYAQAGICEVWLVDLINECIEVYRNPTPQGTYASVQVLKRGQRISIEALPGVEFDVAEML